MNRRSFLKGAALLTTQFLISPATALTKPIFKNIDIGYILPSYTDKIEGYIPLEGQLINKFEYPELYDAVRPYFKSVGLFKFQLPDLRLKIPLNIRKIDLTKKINIKYFIKAKNV